MFINATHEVSTNRTIKVRGAQGDNKKNNEPETISKITQEDIKEMLMSTEKNCLIIMANESKIKVYQIKKPVLENRGSDFSIEKECKSVQEALEFVKKFKEPVYIISGTQISRGQCLRTFVKLQNELFVQNGSLANDFIYANCEIFLCSETASAEYIKQCSLRIGGRFPNYNDPNFKLILFTTPEIENTLKNLQTYDDKYVTERIEYGKKNYPVNKVSKFMQSVPIQFSRPMTSYAKLPCIPDEKKPGHFHYSYYAMENVREDTFNEPSEANLERKSVRSASIKSSTHTVTTVPQGSKMSRMRALLENS
jgi:hypothetical protein